MSRSSGVLIGVVIAVHACTPRPTVPSPESGRIEAERILQYGRAAEAWLDHWKRLALVGSRLLVANTALCTRPTRFVGWTALSRSDLLDLFPDEELWHYLREAIVRRFSIGDWMTVLHIVPESPAERAGTRVGDIILSTEFESNHSTLHARVLRGTQSLVMAIPYRPRCPYSFTISFGDGIVALADGHRIQVTTGLLRFAESDEDLATVLSHELAHNILEYHVDHLATMRNELEADYVAVYLAARAGFDVSGAAEFMRRWGTSRPREIDRGRHHPGTAERAVRIQAAVREVEAKRLRGDPLIPDGLAGRRIR